MSQLKLFSLESNVIKSNNINNNSGYGIHSDSASENEIFSNDLSYNSDISLYLEATDNSTIHNNTFIGNDDYPVTVTQSYYNIIRDNKFVANDDYFQFYDAGGYNSLINNTFEESGILLEDSNNQIISDNSISEASENGIKIYKSSSDNYLSSNTITNSDEEDLYIGGSGYQRNNRGYDNIFSLDSIEVQNNGQFILMDYVSVRTKNSEGNMPGNDVKAEYNSEIFYASDYFEGNDPVTDSFGLVPDFLIPVKEYNGSSSPDEILTTITVRYVDWINSFEMDGSDETSLVVIVPDLRVKNINTGDESYHIQTLVDIAASSDTIIISNGTYYENVVLNVPKITVRGPYFNKLNEDVIIDAQDNGVAVTISKAEITVVGLNITNSYEEEDFFTSSGIKVVSDKNILRFNKVTNSFVGILIDDRKRNTIQNNLIDDVDYGIVLAKAMDNLIENNTIYDVEEHDIELTDAGNDMGSRNNTISNNIDIAILKFKNSDNNLLLYQEATTVNLQGSMNVSAIGSEFDFVICNSESSLYLKNYFSVYTMRENSSLEGVDIKVWDGDTVIYSTDYFDGSDNTTDSEGYIHDILAIYKVYDGSNTGTENTTYLKVRYGDWFLSYNNVFDESTTIGVGIPVFRVYNVDSQIGYNYIQRAIDNASAGDEIILSLGTFNENIFIDKELTLSGSGTGTILTVQPPFGMGSPPIADWTVPGINVTSTDVTISNLQISNFTTGILATNADSLILSFVNVDDIQGVGIHIQESINVELRNSNVISSELSNIIVEENSTDMLITDSIIRMSEQSGVIVRTGSEFFEIRDSWVSDNEDYGCLFASNGVTISNSQIYNNGLNGIYLQSINEVDLSNNEFEGNGQSEVKIISSQEINIEDNYFNATDTEGGGWGIDTSSSSKIEIGNNMFELGLRLTGSDNFTIYDNEFSNISYGNEYKQKTAILIDSGHDNVLSNNIITNVGIGLVFLNDADNNLLENSTILGTSTDVEYYTSGQNNTFINTEINTVDISVDSYFEIINYLDIQMFTINGPVNDVELRVNSSTDIGWSDSVYATEYYGGQDSQTDSDGLIDRLFLVNEIYDGNWVAEEVETVIDYYYDGEDEIY